MSKATDNFAPMALDAAAGALDAITAGRTLTGKLVDDLLAGALAIEWLGTRGTQSEEVAQAAHGLRQMVRNPKNAEGVEARELAAVVRGVYSVLSM